LSTLPILLPINISIRNNKSNSMTLKIRQAKLMSSLSESVH
jgi:hypothetical protein